MWMTLSKTRAFAAIAAEGNQKLPDIVCQSDTSMIMTEGMMVMVEAYGSSS